MRRAVSMYRSFWDRWSSNLYQDLIVHARESWYIIFLFVFFFANIPYEQHWIQDYDNVGKLTDDQGRRAFALVNRATRQALVSKSDGLQLADYKGHEHVDVSMLWSLGVKLASGFSEVRVLSYMSRTLNALGGEPKEGVRVGIFNSEPHYDHAIWKIDRINNGWSTYVFRAINAISSPKRGINECERTGAVSVLLKDIFALKIKWRHNLILLFLFIFKMSFLILPYERFINKHGLRTVTCISCLFLS